MVVLAIAVSPVKGGTSSRDRKRCGYASASPSCRAGRLDLASVTPEELAHDADEINHRPRKTLDWARPVDLLRLAITGDAAHTAMTGA